MSALHEVGAARSIVIDEKGVVLAGNATLEAAGEAGITKLRVVDVDGNTLVAVRRKGLTEAQKTRLALFDNRAAELAEGWDTGVIQQLQADGFDLEGLWTEDELLKLLDQSAKDERPVAFVAALGFPHPTRPGWRLHRLVCLPDYQGVGIGVAVADGVSAILKATGKPVFRTAAHPAVVAHCARSTLWRTNRGPSMVSGGCKTSDKALAKTLSTDRLTAGFEYIGPPAPIDHVRALLPEWVNRGNGSPSRTKRTTQTPAFGLRSG